MADFPRVINGTAITPASVTDFDMPGPLISKSQGGRITTRGTQAIGRSWKETYVLNTQLTAHKGFLAVVRNLWRNGTAFDISHIDYLVPKGTLGGSPVIASPWTNLVENSGCETDIVGWAGAAGGAVTRDSIHAYDGTYACKIDVANTNFSGAVLTTRAGLRFTGSAGTIYTFSYWIYATGTAVGKSMYAYVNWYSSAPAIISSSNATATLVAGWQRISVTGTAPGGTATIDPQIICNGAQGTFTVWADVPQLETGPLAHAAVSTSTASAASTANGQTGDYLYVSGATASVSNWLRAGDLVSVAVGDGIGVYEATADTNSVSTGHVGIPINPPIYSGASPLDGAVVTVTGVKMRACLMEPPTELESSGQGANYGTLQLSFSETLA